MQTTKIHTMQCENTHNMTMLLQNTNEWSFKKEMQTQCTSFLKKTYT